MIVYCDYVSYFDTSVIIIYSSELMLKHLTHYFIFEIYISLTFIYGGC